MSIDLRDVAIQFPDEEKPLLSKINLQVGQGEIFVLIGPSGEGKTVLLKIMAGILKATQGQVFIEGTEPHLMTAIEKEALVRKMGMLFQKNALFDSFSSGENIGFPLRELGEANETVINEKIDYFLERVGIPHAKELFPDEISGGMQKRLGIARALALEPDIIFYDDPTAGLDPITSRMIVELILELQRDRQSTVVAITNDMARAYQMADKIGMVVEGELIVTGNISQTKEHKDPRVHQFIRGKLDGPLGRVTE